MSTQRQAPPETAAASARREEHTFRGNLKSTRHGWLRLTPAYSVRLVSSLLESGPSGPVLDPFCGTGTTLLSCAEHGVDGDSVDINPFLVWLARAKVAAYTPAQLGEARRGLARMRRAVRASPVRDGWVPPLHQIEKWWSPVTLAALSRAHGALERFAGTSSRAASDLLHIAFCQVLIARSRAHFGHQSMSFKHERRAVSGSADSGSPDGARTRQAGERGTAPSDLAGSDTATSDAAAGAPRGTAASDTAASDTAASDAAASDAAAEKEAIEQGLEEALERVAGAAAVPLPRTQRRVLQVDARELHEVLPARHYARVITSPPYANRMSYIRELRPYMYWLRYLEEKGAAGVLDWKAIGGTWGSATSNLGSWRPDPGQRSLPRRLEPLLAAIAQTSPLLSTYVHKYFHDMARHVASLAKVMRRGGRAHYVVGNSKFYEVVVPVEQLLAELFEANGFRHLSVETLRKRSSKKELFEYLISADRA